MFKKDVAGICRPVLPVVKEEGFGTAPNTLEEPSVGVPREFVVLNMFPVPN